MDIDLAIVKANIEELQNTLNQYYKYFLEFYWAKENKESIYKIAHPGLVEQSIKMQVNFLKLPEQLQDRLLHVDFEVFLHCNNVVDLYSFRDYLFENAKHYTIATIVERIDAELKLAWQIADCNIWDKYSILPQINLNFYRKEEHKSILHRDVEDVDNTKNLDVDNEKQTNNEKSEDWMTKIDSIDDAASKSLLGNYTEFVKKSNDAVEKSKTLLDNITPLFKFFWKLLS